MPNQTIENFLLTMSTKKRLSLCRPLEDLRKFLIRFKGVYHLRLTTSGKFKRKRLK